MCSCNIDWGATGNMLAGIGALLTAAAAFFAIVFTYADWKSREFYKNKALDARDILATFFEGRQIMSAIRSPLLTANELSEAEEDIAQWPTSPAEAEKMRIRQAVAVVKRIQRHEKYWEKLVSLSPISKAVFGDEIEDALMSIVSARNDVWFAAQDLMENVYDQDPDGIKKLRATLFWKSRKSEDTIEQNLDKAQMTLRQNLSYLLQDKPKKSVVPGA